MKVLYMNDLKVTVNNWVENILNKIQGLIDCPKEKSRLLQVIEDLLEKIRILTEDQVIIIPQPTPSHGDEISNYSLSSSLSKACPNAKVFLSDRLYKTIYYNSMKDFLTWDTTNEYRYVSEFYDCDDFSYRLHGMLSTPGWADLAAGIAWSRSHAFNIFMSASKEIYLIEPQTDKIIKIEDAQGAYSDIQLVVM